MPGRFLIAVTGRNMSSVGAIYGYGVVQSTLAHSRARCFSAWKKIDIKKPLDALLGIFHLMTERLSRIRNPIGLLRQAPWRLRVLDWPVWAPVVIDWPKSWTRADVLDPEPPPAPRPPLLAFKLLPAPRLPPGC